MAAAARFSQDRVYYDELMLLSQYATEHPKYLLAEQEQASAHIIKRITVIAKAVFASEREYTTWDKRLHHPSLAFLAVICTVMDNKEARLDKIMDVAMKLLREKCPKIQTNPYNVAQGFCVGSPHAVNHDIAVVAFNREGAVDGYEYQMHSDIVVSALWSLLRNVADFDGPIAKAVDVAASRLRKFQTYDCLGDIPNAEKIVQQEHVVVDKPPRVSPSGDWQDPLAE